MQHAAPTFTRGLELIEETEKLEYVRRGSWRARPTFKQQEAGIQYQYNVYGSDTR